MSLSMPDLLGKGLNYALRPVVSRLYAVKRRYGIGDVFLTRHPGTANALMTLLRPFKTRSVVDVHGHQLEVDDGDYLGLTINRVYEPEVTNFLRAFVRSGQTAIDLGANMGYFTLLFARLVGPGGHVLAFEPDPENFELLERNVRANRYANVTLSQNAVSDHPGTALLYRSPVNPGDHRLVDVGNREAVEVQVITLDEALPEVHRTVHWIKMDIQGAEVAALRGMQSIIRSAGEMSIVTEFCPRAIVDFGDDPAELVALLAEAGFHVGQLGRDGSLLDLSFESLLRRVNVADGTYVNLVFTRRPWLRSDDA
jgi:FkbM family methyltransferase